MPSGVAGPSSPASKKRSDRADWQGEVVRRREGLRVPVAGGRPRRLRALRGAARGHHALKAGTRVEFGIAQGRRATRRSRCGSSTRPASVSRNQRDAKRKKPDEMATDRRGPDPAARRRRRGLPPRPAPRRARRPSRSPSCCARSPTSSRAARPGRRVPRTWLVERRGRGRTMVASSSASPRAAAATRRSRSRSSTRPPRSRATSATPSARSPTRWPPIVEDLIRLLDGVGEAYRHGRHPDRQARPSRSPSCSARSPTSSTLDGLVPGPHGSRGARRGAADAARTPTRRRAPRRRRRGRAAAGRAASRCRRSRRSPTPAGAWCRCGRTRWPAPGAGRRAGWSRRGRTSPAPGRARPPGRAARAPSTP